MLTAGGLITKEVGKVSIGAALLYKELFENGTREIAPLEPGDDWIYNSDCADIEVGENWDLIYFEEKLDAYISNAVGAVKNILSI